MNPRQHPGSGLIELGRHPDDVPIAGLAEYAIAPPAIGVGGFATAEVFFDEGSEGAGRDVGDRAESDPATAPPSLLHHGGDDRLLLGRPPRFARLRTAEVALVDLDLAGQRLAIGPHHGAADLLQPRPRRLITAEAELALQFGGRDALLRRGDLEDGAKPQRQRLLALFEDRPGDHRDLAATAGALVDHPLRRQEICRPTAAVGESSGHFRRARYSRHWSSKANRVRNSASLLGNSDTSIPHLGHHSCSPYVLISLTRRTQADPAMPDRCGDPLCIINNRVC